MSSIHGNCGKKAWLELITSPSNILLLMGVVREMGLHTMASISGTQDALLIGHMTCDGCGHMTCDGCGHKMCIPCHTVYF